MTSTLTGLACVVCKKVHEPAASLMTCPDCGEEGILDARYDLEVAARTLTADALASRPADIWRYRELLPVELDHVPPLAVGMTPIYDAPRLASAFGIRALAVKDDGRGPSASFKDRASAVGVARARAASSATIACASTGNAATSLAGMAASAGLDCRIFVPRSAPEPKLVQLLAFGARVYRVEGPYEGAYDLCQAACREFGWYNRNCAINPYLVEGKKTAGLEIGEVLGRAMPDWIVVAVGDGCTVAGVWKGIVEAKALGLVDRMPKMLGVQAAGAAPIAEAFYNGTDLAPVDASTVADSIRVGTPRNWRKALHAIHDSAGNMTVVDDAAILGAIGRLGAATGVFAEPAAAAALAGVEQAIEEGTIRSMQSVLVLVTGNGLKDVAAARKGCPEPLDVGPDPAAFFQLVAEETAS